MDLFHINVKRNNFHWVSRSSFPYWWGHSFSTKKSTMFYPETKPRHTLEHDPPFTVDIGLNIHGLTRKKASNSSVTPAGNLHFLRLCLRAWWVDWQISMRIFWWSRRESYLLPVCIVVYRGLFTIWALLDHLDNYTSTTTSQRSFHCTDTSFLISNSNKVGKVFVDCKLGFFPSEVESVFSLKPKPLFRL